ncbi:MAG: hypothetical protein SFV23_05960 [Planctomycetaceae bacterium]|nr:hypothetical protein [Planctomycetaceae bacterium]
MWQNDDSELTAAEEWIASVARLPKTTPGFRTRVLESAFQAQRRSMSWHRVQTLTSSLLAATVLLCLPGYYSTLRGPMTVSPASPAPMNFPVAAAGLSGCDSFEWALVESALAARHHSARILQQTL